MKSTLLSLLSLVMVLSLPGSSIAVSVTELHDAMIQGNALTIIDIRSNREFVQGHIPGAINIPSHLCLHKQLPSLGSVVVYGDGIDTAQTRDAMEALNRIQGIHADMLEGGFPMWEGMGFPSTRASGASREQYRFVSYQQLHKMVEQNPDVVLIDLRASAKGGAGKGEEQSVDLIDEFPGVSVIDSPFIGGIRAKGPAGKGSASPLYVLIDRGDGKVEKVARKMRAAGIGSFVILAGGESIIARKGRSGRMTR